MSLHDIMIIKLKQDLLTKCKEYQEDIDVDVLHRLIESRTQDVVFNLSEDKSKVKKEERCSARTWSHMKGMRCRCKSILNSDYCGCHSKEMKVKGHLRFDDVKNPPPEFDITKLESGWREKLYWRPSAEQELQNLLDKQSRKVILTTPKLILH